MTLAINVIILILGLAVDGGYALVQRRNAQNSADFAALAAARMVAVHLAGNVSDGTDANVRAAIDAAISINGGEPVTYGALDGPMYLGHDGSVLGYVGSGVIPSGTSGVRTTVSHAWTPYFLRLIGADHWTASASAAARGGFHAGRPPGAMLPVGIAQAFFNNRQPCSGPVSSDPSNPCHPQRLTPGTLNVPGGFGWLKYGCAGYGLGQDGPDSAGGCRNSAGFLQEEIGPPGNSFGCCTQVGLPGSADRIGSLPGNTVSADCSSLVSLGATLPVAVWDEAGGSGANAWYHVVGFTGFQVTGCDGGKDIRGVWRQPLYIGPTTTVPGFAGASLAVQLVK